MISLTLQQIQAIVDIAYGRPVSPVVDLVALTTPLPVDPPALPVPTDTLLALTDLALTLQKALFLQTRLDIAYNQLATYYGDRPDTIITTYTRYGAL